MVKRKVNVRDDIDITSKEIEPRRPGKHSYVYYFKTESQKLKEEGVKVDETVKERIREKWSKLSASEKADFVNSYNKKTENDTNCTIGLVDELIPKAEKNSDKGNNPSRCGVLRFSSIVSSLSIEQQDAVSEIGFGSLLGLKCGRLRQDLCRLLVKQCNVDRRSITLHGTEYKLSPETFTTVMGVGDGGTPIVLVGEDSETSELRAKYCTGKKGIPIRIVVDKLKTITSADNEFCILFSLFAIGTILCPSPGTYINPAYLNAVKDVSVIRSKNWATWSFNFLWEGVEKFHENQVSSLSGCVIFLLLFYMSSTKFRLSSSNKGCPLTAWTDSEIKRFIKWRKNFGDFESNAVPMRENNSGTSVRQNEGEIDRGAAATQHSVFNGVLEVINRIEGHMKRNNEVLEKFTEKMDNLTEKVEKLERAIFGKEGGKVVDDNKSPNPFDGPEASDAPMFSSPNMEMRQPGPAVVTLSDLVRETCKPVEIKDRKPVYLSTSTDEEAILKEKLAGVFEDVRKTKLVPELEDESSAQPEKKVHQDEELNPLSLIPPRPYRSRKPGRYQLSPYDQVSRGVRPKYRAGPFFVNEPVTVDQLKMLQYAFDKTARPDEIIVRSSHEEISRRGLLSLLPDASIDEEIICMMSDYLTRRESCKSQGQPINWFLPTRYAQFTTMPHAHMEGFKAASQYRKRYMCNLHRCQQIFVPMHDGGHHWFLLLVKIKEKQAEIWDPLPDARRTRDREIQANTVLHSFDAILHSFVEATFPIPWSFLSFVVTHGQGVPRQPNGFDCGVYVIKFMDTPGIITNKSYVHDSQNVRAQLALQLMDSPFNEQREQLLTFAHADFTDAANYMHESKMASLVKNANMSTKKGNKSSSKKGRARRKR